METLQEFFETYGERREGGGTVLLERYGETQDLPRPDDGDDDLGAGEWWCLGLPEYRCDCGKRLKHVVENADGHRIIVWPERDDPNLLRVAVEVENLGNRPKLLAYEKAMGKAISFYRCDPS